jgi:hypothetical protein
MIRHILAVALASALTACAQPAETPAAAQEPRPDPLPGTKLSIDQLKAQMFHVSAGRRLKGPWPNGAKIAVGLSFDVDNATATLSTAISITRSCREANTARSTGLPRILRVLDRQQIPASFFIRLRARCCIRK